MSSFVIYQMGAEVPALHSLLIQCHASHVGLSYYALRARLPKKAAYTLEDRFPGKFKLFLDSGGFSANKGEGKVPDIGWEAYGEEYANFALANIDRVSLVTEFDCLELGPFWVKRQRQEIWNDIPREKFLPVWHPDWGSSELEKMATDYPSIGIPPGAFEDIRVMALLRRLSASGTLFHGLAMTKPAVMKQGVFASVSSTSWTSPMRFGDTILWDGTQLKRYPKKMKAQARRRHASLFQREGFDPELIAADDTQEVARLSLWSWGQLAAQVAAQRVSRTEPSYSDDDDEETGSAHEGRAVVVRDRPELVSNGTTPPIRRAGTQTIPGFMFKTSQEVDPTTGEVVSEEQVLGTQSRSARVCDTCFLSGRCDLFQPGHECGYSLPIEIRTKSQFREMLHAVLERQTQRVAFSGLAEELNGGYPDPNHSTELDRLMKMAATIAEIEDDRDFFKVSMEGRGKPGVLSSIFGSQVGQRAQEMDTPADRVAVDGALGRVLDITPQKG